jgi:uncharacterized membrane protein YfcA
MDLLGINPLSVLSGFVVGLLVGLTGVGGGSLMTPLLILVFGTQATTAVGTDLLYASITKAVGSLTHARHGNIDWGIVGRLMAGSLPGSLLTVYLMHVAGIGSGSSPPLITVILGVTLVLSAVAVLARPLIRRISHAHAGERRKWTTPMMVAAGLVLGILVTITSVGAGALGMTMLVILYPGVRLVRLVAADIAHAVPLTLVAGIGHLLLGNIDWTLLALLLLGSVPGITIGSHMSARVPERVLRPLLAAILAVVGMRLLLR